MPYLTLCLRHIPIYKVFRIYIYFYVNQMIKLKNFDERYLISQKIVY